MPLKPKRTIAKSSAPPPVNVSVPGASEATVQIQNHLCEKLVGRFVDTKSRQVVVLCHGFASSKDSPLIVHLARDLALKQFSSLRFDFSGNADSEGVFTYGNYLKEVKDLRAVVLYVREVLQREVVAVVGHSKGANVALLYGAAFDDVPYLVNIAGRYDMKQGVKERFGPELISKLERLGQVEQTTKSSTGAVINFIMTKQDLEERLSLDMHAASRKITIGEVLTVHGSADSVVGVEDAQAFAASIRQHELCVVEGADHSFKVQQHAEACVKKVVEYIRSAVL